MDFEPKSAATYSMNNGTELAYELTYSFEGQEDYKVRAVVMGNG